MLVGGDMSSRNSPTMMSQPQSSEMSTTPEKPQCPDNNGMFYQKLGYTLRDQP